MTGVDDAERTARMRLSALVEPGDAHACHLVRDFSAAELLERIEVPRSGEPTRLADWRQRLERADADALRRRADELAARYTCPGDPEWPAALADLDHVDGAAGRAGATPFGLWVRGADLAQSTAQAVAIVGSRASTGYGDHVAGELAYACAAKGWTVVSGGAYGIDAAAHRGALARERPTVAVLAGGIDRLYPSGNARLLRDTIAAGAVVAEAAPGCAPSKSRFLVRNRLIAALTSGTVVVEAALRSGSLNTARWARDLGREVMGVPGPVTSAASAGVHELLRQPGSTVVTDADEVIEQVSAIGTALAQPKVGAHRLSDELGPAALRVRDALPATRAATAAEIAATAGLRPSAVEEHLQALEAWGEVRRHGDAWILRGGPPR